jgi:hypothetical protein
MLFAPTPIAEELYGLASEFLKKLYEREFDYIWNRMFHLEAMELVATVSFPLYAHSTESIDLFFSVAEALDAMSTAFQKDAVFPPEEIGARTSYFSGLRNSLDNAGWFEPFSQESSQILLHGKAAVLFADTHASHHTIMIPFLRRDAAPYKIDFEAIAAFSMTLSAQKIYRVGTRAMELGERNSAISLFSLAARLTSCYQRLESVALNNILGRHIISDERRTEIRAEYAYALLAQEQVQVLDSEPHLAISDVSLNEFMSGTFRNYSQIPTTPIDQSDIEVLYSMNDDNIRNAIAKLLVGVNPIEAERESKKPHTSAEIADMELMVRRGDELFHLLMPVKSGREIRSDRVPVEVFYQILRPHMFFDKGIVVFVTAKPCSQPLHNYIKQAKDRLGWRISVIEHTELARLLKLNGLLT